MNIQVNWGNTNQSFIHITFEPGWQWEDLKQAIHQADAFIGSVEHTVHLIIDLRGGGGLPLDFLSAARDLFAQGEARANEGQRVVIGAGRIIRAAYKSLRRVYSLENRPFRFADNLEEAEQMLISKPVDST